MKKIILLAALFVSLLAGGLGAQSVVFADAAANPNDVLNNGDPNSPSVCNNGHIAVDGQGKSQTIQFCNDNSTKNSSNPILGPGGVLDKVISILTFIAGAFAVIMVVVSGIRMMLSRGDPSAFNSARNGLIFAAIGLVVAILTRSIVLFILKYI